MIAFLSKRLTAVYCVCVCKIYILKYTLVGGNIIFGIERCLKTMCKPNDVKKLGKVCVYVCSPPAT